MSLSRFCRFVVGLALACAAGCAVLNQRARPGDRPPGMPGAEARATALPQVPREVPLTIVPLPGSLDDTLVFNSNSPEIVTEAGITLSTLPAPTEAEQAVHQGVAFNGTFTVFSHHIAKDPLPGERLLRLGLLAHNRGAKTVTFLLRGGASYLSQPDALFKPLDPIIQDPAGLIFAGPGDRVATDLLHGRSTFEQKHWAIPPGGTALIYDLPIPTDVAILPPINGRTTQLTCTANGPVHLSEVAAFAEKGADGTFQPTRQADFERGLAARRLAGPRDLPAVAFDPAGPPPRGFRYGRVAGVSQGDRWTGDLSSEVAELQPGSRVGVPIASLYLNRLGTGQNQSAPMKSRYADTAYQAHGNYGVTYMLEAWLPNPDQAPRMYTLGLSHPVRVVGDQPARAAVYMDPPGKPVMFRGPVRVRWKEAGAPWTDRYTHLVIRHGEEPPPFETVTVAPGKALKVFLWLVYPADATPPQLLTIGRP